jgi:hypothetical protein
MKHNLNFSRCLFWLYTRWLEEMREASVVFSTQSQSATQEVSVAELIVVAKGLYYQ